MRRYTYVAQVLSLLIGFYLMCAALVAGLVTASVVGFAESGVNRLTAFLLLLTLAGIFVVLRGVFVSTHIRARNIVGIEVTPAEQPALWERIRYLAEQVGTRAPRRLYLTPDVNAAVWENARLLGLVPGKRRMMVGAPLLMALTPVQLDAVLAHELGHYGNRDTQVGGLVGRTRQSVLAALRAAGRRRSFELPGANLFVVVFRAYAHLVLRVTQEASRAQEYAADRVAARIAGAQNAIAALNEIQVIDSVFDFYLERYIAPGLPLGLMPAQPEVFGGFTALLADPARRAQLEELRRNPRPETTDRYDSHPPMSERVAALAALPPDGRTGDGPGMRAVAILANPADVLARIALRAMQKQFGDKRAVAWNDLAHAIGLHRAEERARPLWEATFRLSGRPADLAVFVQMVAAGRLNELLDALPPSEASRRTNATGRVAREHAKTQLASMLSSWLLGHLARGGRVTWTHSWADIDGQLQIAPELEAELGSAVEELVAVRPDSTRLRGLVSAIGVAA